MKTKTTQISLVDPKLREAAEPVPEEGESLSGFVARGLRSRENARCAAAYAQSDEVIARLERMLARAKAAARSRTPR